MPNDAWTVSRDRKTVTTSKTVQIRGNLTVGNARVTKDLTVGGTIKGDVIVGSVHFSQIAGLLGDGFSLRLPDVLDNLATVEIAGIETQGPMVIITGPGYDIERVSGFRDNGLPDDKPGFAMAHPFIFEASGADADNVKAYFDQYLADPRHGGRSMSLIIQERDQSEVLRWNFLSFVPESYELSVDGRTRFRWRQPHPPGADVRYIALSIRAQPEDPFGDLVSCDPRTDKKVEIAGVTVFCPQVEFDEVNRTLTLTFGFSEGHGIFTWVRRTIEGITEKRDLSVIEEENGVEVSRRNCFACFPIKYEQFTGFSLPAKLKARVVLSFDHYEDV